MEPAEHQGFADVTAPNAGVYRQVMLAFVAAKRRFTVHLRPEDVRDAVADPTDLETVAAALRALEGWGNLLATGRGPSSIAEHDPATRLAALVADPPATTDELRNRRIRHRLTRALLEDPVLYYDELTDVELAYLTSQRHAITSRITELTGLVAEVRAEGIAMVDPDDDLTDVRMPEKGTDGHATLLLGEYLAERAGEPVGLPVLHQHLRAMAAEHGAHWRAGAGEPGSEVELTAQALARLAALRLVRWVGTDDGPAVVARPALARYAVTAPTITGGTS